MNKLLILTSYTKFELNSLRNNEIAIKLLITNIFGCRDTAKIRMMSYLNSGYDVMNCFAKFEKFLPHSISVPSFMAVRCQMPELDQLRWPCLSCCPPKLGFFLLSFCASIVRRLDNVSQAFCYAKKFFWGSTSHGRDRVKYYRINLFTERSLPFLWWVHPKLHEFKLRKNDKKTIAFKVKCVTSLFSNDHIVSISRKNLTAFTNLILMYISD